jgi:serine protease Do
LVARVADLPVGSQATLSVDRDGKKMDFKLAIQDRTKVFADDPRIVGENAIPENAAIKGEAQVKFGVSIRPTSEEERDLTPDKHGIAITRVEPGSFAEDVGLMEKDLVVAINRQQVSSVDDIRKIQATLKPGDAVAFRVVRQVVGGGRAKNIQPRTATMFLSGTLPQN